MVLGVSCGRAVLWFAKKSGGRHCSHLLKRRNFQDTDLVCPGNSHLYLLRAVIIWGPPPIQLLYRFWDPKSALKFAWYAFYLWSHIPRPYSVFTVHKAIGAQTEDNQPHSHRCPHLDVRAPGAEVASLLWLWSFWYKCMSEKKMIRSEPWRLFVLIHLR